MKKAKHAPLLVLGALALVGGALTSCGESGKDLTVDSIKIVSGSIKSSYYLDATPSYENLAIDLFNVSKEKIKTLKYAENKTAISFTAIDTSSLGEGKVFTVTYVEAEKNFQDTMTYNVTNSFAFESWSENSNYGQTMDVIANEKISSDEDNLENGFMKKGEYYIGNLNAANLLPDMTAVDRTTFDTLTLDAIPEGASAKLKKGEEEVTIGDYVENVSSFLKDGKLKFKDTVEGEFTLTLSYPGLDDINYVMNVVKAYNVSEAIDLFALDSATPTYPYYENVSTPMKAFKEDHNLPYVDALVIQNDITIGKSDLPSFYYWTAEEGADKAVVGSLKDWLHIINYNFDEANEKAIIYGNSHLLSLNDKENDPEAIPFIKTDSSEGKAQEANKPISSHASLFYGLADYENVDTRDCKFHIQDLQLTGNMGVSEDETIQNGGPMLLKTEADVEYDNVLVSKFYMAIMADGSCVGGGDKKYSDGSHVSPTLTVKNSRLRDSFNAAAYIYGSGNIDIKNSELVKAGGPLLFLNPGCELLPSDASSVMAYAPATAVEADIDAASFLSNFTAGKGGWFEAYEGASAMAGSLVSANQLFSPYSMSFIREKNGVSKFNLLMVNLPSSGGESLSLDSNKGGVNVNVRKDGKTVYSTMEGYMDTMQAAFAYAQASDDASKAMAAANYIDKLSGTFFGNNLAYCTTPQETVFVTTTADGTHEFAPLYQDSTSGNPFLASSAYLIKSGFGLDGGSPTPSDNIKAAGYLAASINDVNAQAGGASDPLSYKGVANYGVILGDYHAV